tara:strand:+ start:2789 stop:3313 length:525 start_codon:yes stop_codon:yes gene_type:complete
MNLNKALFLDRDGIINKLIDNRPPWNLDEIKIFNGIRDIIIFSEYLGYLPIVVTNQPDAGRGKLTYQLLHKINKIICKKVGIKKFYVCDHPYDGMCECRKPKPGMLLKAAKENSINLYESFMIGDRLKDIEAGKAAGCRTISLSKSNLGADFSISSHSEFLGLFNDLHQKNFEN